MSAELPSRIISWYGDDFTGSTDTLEVLAPHFPAVLFLRKPDAALFARFRDYAAFGLAGSSRSQTPEWMDFHLTDAFEWLRSLGSAICHYKVCSTFDSSPSVGNIGRALQIGRDVFGSRFVPILVGAPALRRYTAFGNLFAGVDGTVFRIDRHPTMKCHPVTPMREADLREHLRAQADLRIGLLDCLQLASTGVSTLYQQGNASADAVLIDVLNESALPVAGRVLWSVDRQPFVVGSSGVEYSLIAFWRSEGWLREPAPSHNPGAADRIVVLSGSCSPVTQTQIDFAGRNRFALVRLDVSAITTGDRSAAAADDAYRAATEALSAGRSVVLFTAASPQDRIEMGADRHTLSQRAGQILDRIVDASAVTRIVIAGGDTSSHGGQQLGIDAVTFLAHMAPGAPLCRTWSANPRRRGLEIVFKGGQCGQPDFFEAVRDGRN